jgi:2-polyprenyl-3-methyl-5-hydroxy-6-metoxy-1,4-benzoquinol methylase
VSLHDDWDRHWDDYAASATANPAQEYRRRLILDLLGAGDPPLRVLDVGAGTGDLAAALLAHFPDADLVGLELSRHGVEIAQDKVPRATFLCRNLLEERAPEPRYSAWATHAVCSEVLEHVDDPVRLLANARAHMSEGCRFVVTVPGGRARRSTSISATAVISARTTCSACWNRPASRPTVARPPAFRSSTCTGSWSCFAGDA